MYTQNSKFTTTKIYFYKLMENLNTSFSISVTNINEDNKIV